MYIYPSIFCEYGGEWLAGNKVVVNGKAAVDALEW
jgi:multiple sugar transport system substrate-binding protein